MGLEQLQEEDNDSEVVEDYHHRGYFPLPSNSTMWRGGKVYYRFENTRRQQGMIENCAYIRPITPFSIVYAKYSINVKTTKYSFSS